MRKLKVAILLSLTVSFLSCQTTQNVEATSAISFNEIRNTQSGDIGKPIYFESNDGVKLAYYHSEPKNPPVASLIFIHGGGAYSEAGYQNIAIGLSEKYDVSVYLLDLRGHGYSEGNRGDSPSVKQVWQDIKLFVNYIKNENNTIPLYLGGHSSGGGLILNYDSWYSDVNIEGYIFISPEFGYKSNTERKDTKTKKSENTEGKFVKVVLYPFVINGMTFGLLCGNTPAVYFNYPENVRAEKPLLLTYITCNMSKAMTPNNPQKQFATISKPFYLFVGENDELFDPKKVIQYYDLVQNNSIKQKSNRQIVNSENHLSILFNADTFIGNEIFRSK